MPPALLPSSREADPESAERLRRREYTAAFSRFSAGLTPAARRRINGSAVADWPNTRTFALPVNEESPAYRCDKRDDVIETLEELAGIAGALPTIALWIHDRIGPLQPLMAVDQFPQAIARILEAKNARLEAMLVSLAIGMNFRVNANGYAIAKHFKLSPQTIHEMLGETCKALGVRKPLSKANKARYGQTQYRHKLKKRPPS
jgi:hypothetical protein